MFWTSKREKLLEEEAQRLEVSRAEEWDRANRAEQRANQAEQRIEDAPHGDTFCTAGEPYDMSECVCWKSAAPTTEQEKED